MTNEWLETTLERIALNTASGPFGSNIRSFEYVCSGVPLIRGFNLSGPRFLAEDFVYLTEEKASRLSSAMAFPDDVVLVARGTIGSVGIVPRGPYNRYVMSPNLVKVTVDPKIADPYYVFYYLRSPFGQVEIHSYVSTTGVPKIARALESLRKFRISLPPLPEQRAIAHILGTLDDKIELNRRMSETLEQMARALFKAWFVDFEPVRAKMEGRWRRGESLPGLPAHLYDLFPGRLVDSELGQIPEGWEVGRLGDILAQLVTGARPKGGAVEEGVPSIGAENVIGLGKYDFSKEKYIPQRLFEELKRKGADVRPKDILLYKDGAYIGRKTYFEGTFPHTKCAVNEHVFILRTRHEEMQRYLFFWLDQDWMTQEIVALNSNSAQPGINQAGVKSLPILLPSQQVLNEFDRAVGPLVSQIFALAKQSRTLAALRDALLPRLISGEIRVKDAERFLKERGL